MKSKKNTPATRKPRKARWVSCVALGYVAMIGSYAHGANHLEAPLISFERNIDNVDVYVFQDPVNGDKVHVAADVSDPGFPVPGVPRDPNRIVYNVFQGDLDEPFFVDLRGVFDDVNPGLNAVRPQIAANSLGIVGVVFSNDTDFFSGPPPFEIPSAAGRFFDFAGNPLTSVLPLGTPGAGQRPPAISNGPINTFYINFAEGLASNGAIGGSVVTRRYNADGTVDSTFNAAAITEADPSFDGFTAVKGTRDGGAAVVRVGGFSGGFPNPGGVYSRWVDVLGDPLGPDVQLNQSPAYNANLVDLDQAPNGLLHIVYQQINKDTFAPEASFTRLSDLLVNEVAIGIGRKTGTGPINPKVAVNNNGDTIITYHAESFDPTVGFDRGDIFAEFFAANGTRIGGAVRVNSITEGIQNNASVDDTSDGGYVIGFTSENSTTNNKDIYGIDLPAPLRTGPKTVAAHDFATPWTPIELAGLIDALYNDGPTDADNNVTITSDPLNLDSTNGVLQFKITDATSEVPGVLKIDFDDDLVEGGFPNGRRFGDDVVDITLRATINTLTIFDILGTLTLEAIDQNNPDDRPFVAEFPYLTFTGLELAGGAPLAGDTSTGDTWMDLHVTAMLSPEQVAILDGIEHPAFSYSLTLQSDGPALVYIDDLRVDLRPVPEPDAAAALAACGLLAMGTRGRRRPDAP